MTDEIKKKKVLLVEDDEGCIDTIGRQLKKYENDIDLEIAHNAEEAIKFLEDNTSSLPDTYILDIMMPYGSLPNGFDHPADPNAINSGLWLLDLIRNRYKQTDVWVAVTTARSAAAVETEVKKLQGNLYYKPFSPKKLISDLVISFGLKPMTIIKSLQKQQ